MTKSHVTQTLSKTLVAAEAQWVDNNTLHTESRAARLFLLARLSPRPGERCRYPTQSEIPQTSNPPPMSTTAKQIAPHTNMPNQSTLLRTVTYKKSEYLIPWRRRKRNLVHRFILDIPYGLYYSVVPGRLALNELCLLYTSPSPRD